MGIVLDRGRYYWVKRVPKRYAGVVKGADGRPVSQVRVALQTDSKSEAQRKAAQIEVARLAEWEALLVGDTAGAARHYANARRVAEARGFAYVPISDLALADPADIVARVLALADKSGRLDVPPAVAEAVLGAVSPSLPTLTELLDEYIDLTKSRHIQKSEAQRHKWELPRRRAVRNFLDAVFPVGRHGRHAERPIDQITREDVLKYRAAVQDRITAGTVLIATANKEVGQLSEIVGTWIKLTRADIQNLFSDARFDGKDADTGQRPPFSREWVVNRIFAPGGLDGLNEDARDVLCVIVNTGARESEITDAPVSDFVLDAEIPHIRIAPNGRQLKQGHTRREIPLVGIALDAARRIVARGGSRYHHKAGSFSALVNKYFSNNGLKETPAHTVYGLRHYVEDQLQAAGADDRIRADILGHKYQRPKYGDGGALAGRLVYLEKIALQ